MWSVKFSVKIMFRILGRVVKAMANVSGLVSARRKMVEFNIVFG